MSYWWFVPSSQQIALRVWPWDQHFWSFTWTSQVRTPSSFNSSPAVPYGSYSSFHPVPSPKPIPFRSTPSADARRMSSVNWYLLGGAQPSWFSTAQVPRCFLAEVLGAVYAVRCSAWTGITVHAENCLAGPAAGRIGYGSRKFCISSVRIVFRFTTLGSWCSWCWHSTDSGFTNQSSFWVYPFPASWSPYIEFRSYRFPPWATPFLPSKSATRPHSNELLIPSSGSLFPIPWFCQRVLSSSSS